MTADWCDGTLEWLEWTWFLRQELGATPFAPPLYSRCGSCSVCLHMLPTGGPVALAQAAGGGGARRHACAPLHHAACPNALHRPLGARDRHLTTSPLPDSTSVATG